MDLTWNLDNIYTSFNSKEFKYDMESLERCIEDIKNLNIDEWGNHDDTEKNLEKVLRLYNKYKEYYFKISTYACLVMNADFENIEAVNSFDNVESRNAQFTQVEVRFCRYLKSIENLDEIIDRNEYLLEHKFYLHELLMKSKYLLSEKEETVISKMRNTGSRAWSKYYMELSSTATVDINDNFTNLTLSDLKNMLYEKDSELRKAAYLKEIELCKEISIACAKCINGISGEAISVYEMKGYKSPLDKILIDSRMDRETLEPMICAIKESLPVFKRFYEKKGELLGHINIFSCRGEEQADRLGEE